MGIRDHIGVLLLCLAMQCPGALRASAQIGPGGVPSIADLDAEIVQLRSNGRYEDAIPLATTILERLLIEENDSPFAFDDARNSLITLTHIAGLSEMDRCELREADAAAGGVTSIAEIDAQVEIRSRLLGPQHFETLVWLMQSAIVRLDHHLVSDAELMYRRSLEGFRATLGEDHPRTLRNQSHLAMVMHFQGDYAEAERLFRLVVESRRRIQGSDHDDTRAAEVNLARMLYELGHYQEAGALYRKLFDWFRIRHGEENYITLACMGGLGCSLRATGQLDEAERLLRRRIEIDRKHQNGQTNDIDALYALALVLFEKGDWNNAERECREALAVHDRIKHVEDPKLLNILNVLAESIQAQGRYAEAEATWQRSATSYENIRSQASYSGFERIRFAADASPLLRFAACLAHNGHPEAAWRQLERGLARGLTDVINVSTDPSHPAISADEQLEKSRLLVALSATEERVSVLNDQAPIDEIAMSKARRERNIRRADLIAFEKQTVTTHGIPAAEPYDLAQIQHQIPVDTAIVAWIDFPGAPADKVAGGEHWACVLRHRNAPRWIRLSDSNSKGSWTNREASIADRVASELAQRPTMRLSMEEDIAALRQQRLDPIESCLTGIRHLVVLPIGPMSRVPVQALTDRYSVSYSPSATLFAWLSASRANPARGSRTPSLLALGNPNAGTSVDPDLRSIPGAEIEVRAIADLFASSVRLRNRVHPKQIGNSARLTLLMNDEAREANLQSLAQNDELRHYSHIHLSAHGILDDVAPWRSALVLSPRSQAESSPTTSLGTSTYDGRLTAEQILQTWRLDADLVTLSGCETGLGKSEGGEGFVGFSHALFASGARSLILSLWKVDDLATTLLMHRLYENLTGEFSGERIVVGETYSHDKPMSKAAALCEAKHWLRANSPMENQMALQRLGFDMLDVNTAIASARGGIRMTGEEPLAQFDYSDPHYWAAFVLSGSPD